MEKVKMGLYGLGKMGKNIGLRLLDKGYEIVVYNRSIEPIEELKTHGAIPAESIEDMISKLNDTKIVWLMLPAGDVTDEAIKSLSEILHKGDVLIDGSNNRYTDDIRHNELLLSKGIHFIDAGCSGGPSGALNGMSIMIGGDHDVFLKLEQLFKDLSVDDGYCYIGESGSGHFVKMVHNAIEYGMMQSIAEGLDLVTNGPYKNLNIKDVCHVWNNGSVISGNLMKLSERALSNDPKLKSIEPYVEDTGEGRWAAETAIKYGVPFTVLSHSLYERFSSRDKLGFGRRMLAALRHEFGGHDVKKSD